MLKQRLLTATCLAALIVPAVMLLTTPMFALLLALFVCLAAWEWATLSGYHTKIYKVIYTLLVLVCLIYCFTLRNTPEIGWIVYFGLFWWCISIGLVFAYQKNKPIKLSPRPVKAGIGLLILIPAWLSLILIHENSYSAGANLVLFLLFLIWLADGAAYFAGKRFGKSQLLSRVSPSKSWEGVYGGFLVATLFSLIYVSLSEMSWLYACLFMALALVTVLFSILGDLVESVFKRVANLQDSGKLLPGHGGVLDRVDSLTAAAPCFIVGLWLLDDFT